MSDETMTIEVDGLSATVDAEEYGANPESTIAKVRADWAAASDLSGLHEPFEYDYDQLVEMFGEDE